MQGRWWKILGVIILVYTFLAGLLVPLKPGIVAVAPERAQSGKPLELRVTGYNSQYRQAGQVSAWLKVDADETSYLLKARKVNPLDDRHLELLFSLPPHLPAPQTLTLASLILDNPLDGASVLPEKVAIQQDSVNVEAGRRAWSADSLALSGAEARFTFPFRNILSETIRNTYFHVPLWFAMLFLFLASVVFSIRYLRGSDPADDRRAWAFTQVGIVYGLLGLITGAIWAKNTWGAYWSFDVKQNMTAIALLIYLAYFILRAAVEQPENQGRIAAVYNIFAFVALIPLIYVIPRLTDSLHPGAGGNPALGGEDLDNTMRMVFYPAIIGWSLLGFWIASLTHRAAAVRDTILERA